jgi:hypothetical protein
MGTLYMAQNCVATTAGPGDTAVGQISSASLFTQVQLQTSIPFVMRVVEWGVSFGASALLPPFVCDLIDSFAVAATVTSYAVADVSVVNPDGPAQAGTTTGVPFVLSTTASGFLSGSEATPTSIRTFDSQMIEPIGGYYKQFPLGREPLITPGHNLRLRVRGDGATKCVAYVVVEV